MSRSARKGATAPKVRGKSPVWDSPAGGSLTAMRPFVVTCKTKQSDVEHRSNVVGGLRAHSQGAPPGATL